MWRFPGQLECVMTPRPLTRFLSNFVPIISQPTRTQLRSSAPRRSTKNAVPQTVLQRARSCPRRCSLAMGHRSQTGAPPKAAPHRLRRGASPRRRATHDPLGARQTRAVLSVTRSDSRNQGSMPSCYAVPIVPSHLPHNQGPRYHQPSNFVIHPSNPDRIISSMLSLPVEPAYPLDQSSQSLTSTYPCLICVLLPNYACMYHTK